MPQAPETILEGKDRPFNGAEFLELARRRPRGLHLRRAGRERHDAPGVPQRRRLRRPALRRAARSEHQGRADRADRYRLARLHPQVLQGGAQPRGGHRPARRHRGVGAPLLRLDGPQPRLQGRVPQHARRQCRVLRKVRRQRARLAQAGAGGGALSQPRARQSADRPQQAGRAGQGRLHHRAEGDRRRHRRLRRQGGRHQFGADPLQFPRPEHGPGDHRPQHGGDVHRADEHAGHQADLPAVLRVRGRRHRLAVGLSAHLPVRRERRHLRVRQRLHPLGERPHLPRHRAAQGVLSALRLLQRLHAAGLHAARGQARFHRRPAPQGGARDRRRSVPRRAGADRRGDRLAQPVLVAHRRHGLQSGALGRRRGAAELARVERLSPVHDRSLSGGARHRREGDLVGPHLSAVAFARLQESEHRQVSRPLRARLERHRLQGAHQDHEAPVGRRRHRVRRPPRALRDELFRQPRAGAAVPAPAGAGVRRACARWRCSPSAAWRTTTRTAGGTPPITTGRTSRW